MKKNLHSITRSLCLALGLAAACSAALAQTSLKVGGLRTVALLPVTYALQKGYFKREGLDVEVVTVNSGPAVISAVMSDSVQIGYSGVLPVMYARAQNQPVQIFTAFTYETAKADGKWTWLIASSKSGVKSAKDLAGKTVAINASGALCEILVREHLAKAGVAWDAVKKIVVPFPQMQAALQLGNADAACLVEPFRTNVNVSPAIQGVTLGSGVLADKSAQYSLDILFAKEAWGKANKDTLRRFNKGLKTALDDFMRDPALWRNLITEEFKLSPAVVSLMKKDLTFSDLQPKVSDIQPLVEGLERNGMLSAPLKAEDVVLRLD
ncbi:ABC transporter substrate-binding protein [Variovorax dokdonensis]|uniref:ABC transporter substrate-binding protein n=1 Tax=Variovorax dokdonensis TaxID=344883 RepID=A0ABT7NCF4_9BURK|nr:ABC transporter substrate-binding protein [Variovorax dokdonensis]MDM0045632.1 ABC transporter substrate-binding protein [Variovorax dokdonensis]